MTDQHTHTEDHADLVKIVNLYNQAVDEVMRRANGDPLPGIIGRSGIAVPSVEGLPLGLDMITMKPGSGFPFHTHVGHHILFVLDGSIRIRMGQTYFLCRAGDSIYIPAAYPHSVLSDPATTEHATFLALGYPHRAVASEERMQEVADDAPPAD